MKRKNINHLTFLDCSKAFDRVKFSKLFNILLDKRICPLVVRLLIVLYSNIEGHVKWNNFHSSNFKIKRGVKQGGVISPILFTIYTDKLIEKIIQSGMGCYAGDCASSALMYADDIVLLAPTRSAMQHLLYLCEEFGTEFKLTFNPDKCETILFGRLNNSNVGLNLFFNNILIPVKCPVKHLGHLILNNRHLYDLKNTISEIRTRTNIIMSNFSFLSTDSRICIFNSNCNGSYGCELVDLNSKDIDKLDCAWRVCSRRILKVPSRTHCCLLPGLMNTWKLLIKLYIES